MEKRTLGRGGLKVSALGLGCMGMSWAYGPADDQESLKVLQRALELGVNFWDTAEIYGPFKNEELLGKALRTVKRDQVVIATKFAWEFGPNGERVRRNSKPEHIKKTIEGSLKRLGTDYIDLYYQHRLDPETPIEETVGALKDLIQAGKIRHYGLSEVGPATIRRAHKVHPIGAVQSEYSLWERGVEAHVLPTLRELGVGFVPYSPMGRGFLTGTFQKKEDIPQGDWRQSNPRFQGENFDHNLRLVEDVKKIAAEYKATPAQIALAWLLHQGPEIVPIPGTKRVKYLEENAKAADLKLPASAWTELNKTLAAFKPAGLRYPEDAMQMIDTDNL